MEDDEKWPLDHVPRRERKFRSHRGSSKMDGANKIVWGVCGVLAIGGMGLFSWNLYATLEVKDSIVDSRSENRTEFAKMNAALTVLAHDQARTESITADLQRSTAELQSRLSTIEGARVRAN